MKFGRLPRTRHPGFPHMSALTAGRAALLPPVPATCDYALASTDIGMLGNDTVGDCTCAGEGHALQVWSRGAVQVDAAMALLSYRENSSWDGVPGDATDTGAVEQQVLQHWLNVGFPMNDTGSIRDKLFAFFEFDPARYDQWARAIYECGVVYLGFNVPAWMEQEAPPEIWDRGLGDEQPVGGHCVIAVGYGGDTINVCSWGRWYRMTIRFVEAFVDEAYALVSPDWVNRPGGVCPLNLSLADLAAQMRLLRY